MSRGVSVILFSCIPIHLCNLRMWTKWNAWPLMCPQNPCPAWLISLGKGGGRMGGRGGKCFTVGGGFTVQLKTVVVHLSFITIQCRDGQESQMLLTSAPHTSALPPLLPWHGTRDMWPLQQIGRTATALKDDNLDPHQFGFRIVTALVTLLNDLCWGLDKVSLLLELSVVFNPIDHDVLLGLLAESRVGDTVLLWCCSFLTDSCHPVLLGDARLAIQSLTCGVSQSFSLPSMLGD